MGRLLILPFVTRPKVGDVPVEVVPIGPIYAAPADCKTTRDDVIRYYRMYLGRDPEDEGAIAGRIGLPCLDVELEIASSDEALAYLHDHGVDRPRTVPPAVGNGLTEWSKRAGMLIADALAERLGMNAAPVNTWVVFAVQAQREDAGGDPARSQGAAYNNPLNLSDAGGTIQWPNQSGRYMNRFASFPSLPDGARACALNYAAPTYANVQAAFRSGDLLALARAIQQSPWDEDHYGGTLDASVQAALTA